MLSGRAKVCCNAEDGKSLILCWYISDGVIGEVGLMSGLDIATTTVKAISEFSCIAIEQRYCAEELKRNIAFSNKLGAEMAKKLVARTNAFSSQAFYTGKQRVCSYIMEAAYQNTFSDMLTDVASSIGISYRYLLRILQQLCDDGVLERRESGFYILDWDKLQPPNPNEKYKTKTFLEYEVEGVDVDIMAGFAIENEGQIYDCSLRQEQIVEYVNLDKEKIPLQSLELWLTYYELMGRKDKVEMIKN